MLRLLLVAALQAGTGLASAQSAPPPGAHGRPDEPLAITFLDVGQGDAILIQAPGGRTALVDAGPQAPLDELRDLGITSLDLVVATHPHHDHIGGMDDVLAAFSVRFYMDNGHPHTTDTYRRLLDRLEASPEVTYLEAIPRRIALGEAEVEVLPLPPGPGDQNDRSIGLVVRFGAFEAFLSGDSEEAELMWWTDRGAVPDVELLKAPHHGGDSGVTDGFLRAARPEVVVISVGPNSYGHPGMGALAAYAEAGARIERTDRAGSVTVVGRADGSWEVRSGPVVARRRAEEAGDSIDSGDPDVELHVVADAPGNDHHNPNGEYAVLRNGGSAPLDLSGWVLCDLARHCYRFARSVRLDAGATLSLHTGRGRDGNGRLYWGRSQAVWNNDGDTAVLTDAEGRVRARHVY
ncbi:MAG: lamin tail domain-containing protein [Longimicrobiales bacterium]